VSENPDQNNHREWQPFKDYYFAKNGIASEVFQIRFNSQEIIVSKISINKL